MLFHKLTHQENIPLKLPSLQLNGIERENSSKFPGIILDEHLTWENHIQLTEAATGGVLPQACNFIKKEALAQLFSCESRIF